MGAVLASGLWRFSAAAAPVADLSELVTFTSSSGPCLGVPVVLALGREASLNYG